MKRKKQRKEEQEEDDEFVKQYALLKTKLQKKEFFEPGRLLTQDQYTIIPDHPFPLLGADHFHAPKHTKLQAAPCNLLHVLAKSKALYFLRVRVPPVEMPPTPLPRNARSSTYNKPHRQTMDTSHPQRHTTINTLADVILVFLSFLRTALPLLPRNQYEQKNESRLNRQQHQS